MIALREIAADVTPGLLTDSARIPDGRPDGILSDSRARGSRPVPSSVRGTSSPCPPSSSASELKHGNSGETRRAPKAVVAAISRDDFRQTRPQVDALRSNPSGGSYGDARAKVDENGKSGQVDDGRS